MRYTEPPFTDRPLIVLGNYLIRQIIPREDLEKCAPRPSPQETEDELKEIRAHRIRVGLFISLWALFLIAGLLFWIKSASSDSSTNAAQFGDWFGSINALLTALALTYAIRATSIQGSEFKLARKEYRESKEALQLQSEVSVITATLEAVAKQIDDASEESQKINKRYHDLLSKKTTLEEDLELYLMGRLRVPAKDYKEATEQSIGNLKRQMQNDMDAEIALLDYIDTLRHKEKSLHEQLLAMVDQLLIKKEGEIETP